MKLRKPQTELGWWLDRFEREGVKTRLYPTSAGPVIVFLERYSPWEVGTAVVFDRSGNAQEIRGPEKPNTTSVVRVSSVGAFIDLLKRMMAR